MGSVFFGSSCSFVFAKLVHLVVHVIVKVIILDKIFVCIFALTLKIDIKSRGIVFML